MPTAYTTKDTTVAWLAYVDDLRCVDTSTASKTAWLKSLHLGHLNKSVNEKLRVYSHLRSLSSKLSFPFPKYEAPSRRQTLRMDASDVEIDGEVKAQKEHEESKKQAVSLVILEDYSRPPQVMEEVTPLLFTSTAFFQYAHSGKWGGCVSMRVINGELLDLLLEALSSLEMRFQIDSTIIYASLNNRTKPSVEEDTKKFSEKKLSIVRSEEPTKKAVQNIPQPYEPRKEFVYEKMNVDIVFYEKSEASNIPYVIPENDNRGQISQVPLQREIVRFPYALQQHDIDYIRLPASEDTDIKSTILRLEAELKELKKAETSPKDVTAQAPLPEKANAVSDKVEWIAADPYLVPVHDDKAGVAQTGHIRSEKGLLPRPKTPLRKPSRTVSETMTTMISAVDGVLLSEINSVDSKNATPHEWEGAEEDTTIVQSVKSSEASFVIISSPTEFINEEEEEGGTLKKLNLTRNELYVAGLYSPRKENALSIQNKLQQTKQRRLTRRLEQETRIYEKLKENVPFDIADRFKCLAATAKVSANKKTAPESLRKAKMPKRSLPAPMSLWERYYKDQEDMEMDSALINDIEKGIFSRILTHKDHKLESEPELKGKLMKNKTKNNRSSSDVSLARLKKEKLQNRQRSTNSNASENSKSGSQDNPSEKSELPLIDCKKKIQTGVTEHKSKRSVTLPPLSQNKIQGKQFLRVRTDETSHVGNKVKTGGFHTDVLGDNITGSENINKKQTSKDQLKFKKKRKDTSLEKDTVQNPNNHCKKLSSRRSRKNSNRNRNRNSLSVTDEEEEESSFAEDPEEVTESGEYISTPESSLEHTEEEVKSVDSYDQQLQQYTCECSCAECVCLTETLRRETARMPDKNYPLFLGRMRRDFKFLKYANYEPKGISTCADTLFSLPEINHQYVCDNLLKLMETTMIRKEIVTSSLGYRYITVTFTRPDVSNQMSFLTKQSNHLRPR